MPTYEYKCESCQRRFEVFQRMTDQPLTQCTECRGQLKRLIGTGAGFLFKGSGFYVTDYRSESYKSAEKRASSEASPAAPAAASGSKTGSATAAASGSSTGSAEKK